MGIKVFFHENKYKNSFGFFVNLLYYKFRLCINVWLRNKRKIIIRKYKTIFLTEPDLNNPKTLNEKLQWIKLFDHKDLYTICADKFTVREYLRNKFGEEFLIPLIFVSENWKDITRDNINSFPCIVKANHTSKDYVIIRNPDDLDWNELRYKCRWWLHRNYYAESLEWQYKNIKRKIVVERLLQNKEGRIPNDYKLHYFNGELQFVYVSVDREGQNRRNIYDANWQPLFFSWDGTDRNAENRRGDEISAPESFELMKKLGAEIAKEFSYIRVDYYDVDGKLYFGELTLQHGGGFDVFIPEEYDLFYGEKLHI